MSKPIEATPVFEGEDARDLLDALNVVTLSEEDRRRQAEIARQRIIEFMRPKGFRHG